MKIKEKILIIILVIVANVVYLHFNKIKYVEVKDEVYAEVPDEEPQTEAAATETITNEENNIEIEVIPEEEIEVETFENIPQIEPESVDTNIYDAEPSIVYATAPLNIRETPDGNVLEVVPVNTELTRVGENGNYTVVSYNGNNRYVTTQYTSKEKVNIVSRSAKARTTPDGESLGTYVLTAYCGCSSCCGKSTGITASGARATAGVTIAAPSNFAFGTQLKINGHVYTVQDRGGAIKGNRIDIYFNSHSEALRFGRQTATVYKIK